MLGQARMNKVPSRRSLLFLIFFTAALTLSNSYTASAYLLDQAKEYRFKADKLHSKGKLDQAITYYQKAIGIDKYCLSAYNSVAICYEEKGLVSQAESWYLKALEINPRYAPVHYNLGLLYERYGSIKKAIFHWRERIRLGHPGDPAAIKARAKLEVYAPDELQKEDAEELNRRIARQKEQGALDKITGRNRYVTKEEKIKEYYLEGMRLYQSGAFRQARESFQKMIETLPVSKYPIEK